MEAVNTMGRIGGRRVDAEGTCVTGLKTREVVVAQELNEMFKEKIETQGKWIKPFLKSLTDVPIIAHACKVTGISRRVFFYYREESPEFAKAVELALEEGREQIIIQIHRKARQGNMVAAIFLAKAWFYGLGEDRNKDPKAKEILIRREARVTTNG